MLTDNFRFFQPQALIWASCLILVLCLRIIGLKRYQNVFKKSPLMRHFVPSIHSNKAIMKFVLLFCSFVFLTLALLRPQGNPKPQVNIYRGRDVVFVIDVSKSMMATDVVPNRLEKVKIAIKDFLAEFHGNRVGLVVFAGTHGLKSPLTTDYNFLRYALDSVTVNDISRGGTNIGDTLRYVTRSLFKETDANFQDIILFTDGEDHQSMPVEVAKEAGDRNIRIITVGIGSPDGSKIVLEDNKVVKYEGAPVISRLDEKLLREIAAQTPNGFYVPLRTGMADFRSISKKYFSGVEKKQFKGKESFLWSELYQTFLTIGLILLLISSAIPSFQPAIGVKND